jgi:PTH1 family peptidyl-tRNA hydrolase
MKINLVVGLGNPGQQYINNRHNVGYKVIDQLMSSYGVWPSIDFFDKRFEGIIRVGYTKLVILSKPTTMMNNSGLCVSAICKELKINPSNILVIYDDITLPLGTIRFRESGSSGGHNGIKSIIEELGTESFNRLKIGIGKPIDGTSILDYVLGDFTKSEDIEAVIKNAEFITSNILDGVITQGDTFTCNTNVHLP